MRPVAAVAALTLLALSACPPSAADPMFACSDGLDNDADGRIDWTSDPGCSAPDDDSERACSPDAPSECAEEVPCPGMLPPAPLTAERTIEGVLLEWEHPVTGPPVTYLVYRVELDDDGPLARGQERVGIHVGGTVDDLALAGRGGKPVGVTVRVPERDVFVTVPASLDPMSWPEPYAAVPGSQTSFLDTEAQPDEDYAYWVQGATSNCRGPMSNLAFVIDSRGFPPRLEDCFYWEPPGQPTTPSTNCLNLPPVLP